MSARDNFEFQYPDAPHQWKIEAFRAELVDRNPSTILSIGDGYEEREACEIVAKEIGCKSLSIKFIRNPSVQELEDQLALVSLKMKELLPIRIISIPFPDVLRMCCSVEPRGPTLSQCWLGCEPCSSGRIPDSSGSTMESITTSSEGTISDEDGEL